MIEIAYKRIKSHLILGVIKNRLLTIDDFLYKTQNALLYINQRSQNRLDMPVKVLMIDPSLFTAAYDKFLNTALLDIANNDDLTVEFWGRHPRVGEPPIQELPNFTPHFYSNSEQLLKKEIASKIALIVKAAEHILNWLSLCVHLHRFDIIHFQWIVLPMVDYFFLKYLKRRKRLILTVHDTTPFLGTPTSRIQTWKWKDTVLLFDQYIVHTKQSKHILISWGIPDKNIIMSPLPGTLSEISAKKEARHFKSILLFGSIKKYKGADILLNAFAELPINVRKNWKVEIIGQLHDECKYLPHQAKALGIEDSVKFDSRYVDDSEIAQLAMNADIFCFPYRQIDTSGILMSFIRLGKPIIASKVGVFNDLLTDNKDALLCPPENHKALAEKLEKLMSSQLLRDSLGEAVAYLNNNNDWSKAAAIHKNLYLNHDLI